MRCFEIILNSQSCPNPKVYAGSPQPMMCHLVVVQCWSLALHCHPQQPGTSLFPLHCRPQHPRMSPQPSTGGLGAAATPVNRCINAAAPAQVTLCTETKCWLLATQAAVQFLRQLPPPGPPRWRRCAMTTWFCCARCSIYRRHHHCTLATALLPLRSCPRITLLLRLFECAQSVEDVVYQRHARQQFQAY